MTKAIVIIVLVLLFIIGGMVTLLRSANQKIPENYDRSKLGFDDEDDDWPDTKKNNASDPQSDRQEKNKP